MNGRSDPGSSRNWRQLLDTLESEYNVTGDTKEKAARFFISAAQYAGIPLSTHILKGGISAGRRRPSAGRRVASVVEESDPNDPPPPPLGGKPPSTGGLRTVTLSNGGTLTISASVDLFTLNAVDREFVFGLIDKLAEYESKTKSPAKP